MAVQFCRTDRTASTEVMECWVPFPRRKINNITPSSKIRCYSVREVVRNPSQVSTWSCPLKAIAMISAGWGYWGRGGKKKWCFWMGKFQGWFTKQEFEWTQAVSGTLRSNLKLPSSFLGWFQQNQNRWSQPTRNKDARKWLNLPSSCALLQMLLDKRAPSCFSHGIT